MGWSKSPMIEKQRVDLPGSSPAWKRNDVFQPCCDPQLIGNSWPGTRDAWMQRMGFSVFDHFGAGWAMGLMCE